MRRPTPWALLAVAGVLPLAACGGDAGSAGSPVPEPAAVTTTTVDEAAVTTTSTAAAPSTTVVPSTSAVPTTVASAPAAPPTTLPPPATTDTPATDPGLDEATIADLEHQLDEIDRLLAQLESDLAQD